ncbi:hypothetical protein GCM10007886_08260 [Methylobacterium gregans]|nr:hypothetical protein GCM10007886_08260 [Methylobacterium gregans]
MVEQAAIGMKRPDRCDTRISRPFIPEQMFELLDRFFIRRDRGTHQIFDEFMRRGHPQGRRDRNFDDWEAVSQEEDGDVPGDQILYRKATVDMHGKA